jgi:hypothetical protein
MIRLKKEPIRFLFVVAVFAILVQLADATATSFTVPKGEAITRSISLVVEDRVLVKFTVVGQTASTLDFYITDPNGDVKVEYSRVGTVSYPFICDEAGEYVLHFSNTDTSEDKLVTLDYEISHYIFGIPQMLFLTIIIVLVSVAAVATFTLMGKSR